MAKKQIEVIPCFACGTELKNWYSERVDIQPMRGLHFLSHGHYGSAEFDPISKPGRLDIVICDECLRTHIDSRVFGDVEMTSEMELRKYWENHE